MMIKDYYCECLACKHTGSITGENTNSLVCPKCKSKNIRVRFYRHISDGKGTHDNIVTNYDRYRRYDIYGDAYDEQEYKTFEDEHKLDALMMAPTGWEDDEEIQNYMGISPEDIEEDHKQSREADDPPIWCKSEKNLKRTETKCDHPGCNNTKTYRVPRTHDLKGFWRLCKEHLIENNLKCNHPGCSNAGTCLAPKHSNSKEYILLCEGHAAEYNQKMGLNLEND